MVNIVVAVVALSTFAGLCCGLRAWTIFKTYLPAASVLVSSDYRDTMPNPNDPYSPGSRIGPDTFRGIEERVRFEDVDGHRCVATVKRQVANRYQPDGSYMIWYDPADTTKATVIGPMYWVGWMCACFGLAASAIWFATKIA